MDTAIISGIFGIITAIISATFTNRMKNKEIELQREINEKEIESLKEQHQHDLDKLKLKHQHELDKIEIEKRSQLELNSQTGIDGLVQKHFSKELEKSNSPMSKMFNHLMQDEIDKLSSPQKLNTQITSHK